MKCILNVEKFCQKSVQKLQSLESGARKNLSNNGAY